MTPRTRTPIDSLVPTCVPTCAPAFVPAFVPALVPALVPACALAFTLLAAAIAAPLAAQEGASTAGRAAAKRFANLGMIPVPEMIVIEDIVNYHRHRIPLPKAGADVALDLRWDASQGGDDRESVLQIGYATARLHDTKSLRPLNLALVIDQSGSMAARDKMRRVQHGLEKFVRKLRAADRIAIVGYATDARVLLPSQPVGDGRAVMATVRRLAPSGSTNLHAGLMLGYREVAKCREELADHRVLLLTDGIANQGVTDAAEIAAASRRFNDRGIDLSTIGVGSDFNRDLLADLAKAGRGLFHYVADEEDIQKVFVTEAQSLVGIVARDVELVLDHGPGIEVDHIYGYDPRHRAHGFAMGIENFNYGMTGVVMVRFRACRPRERATVATNVRVELRYTAAATGRRKTLRARSRFLDATRAGGTTDHAVRKNYTIAVLAQATRDMAVAANGQRYGEAERAVCDALEFYQDHYPDTDDPDLRSNRRTLEKYRQILAARIERFRR